jgi:hypothetical protein
MRHTEKILISVVGMSAILRRRQGRQFWYDGDGMAHLDFGGRHVSNSALLFPTIAGDLWPHCNVVGGDPFLISSLLWTPVRPQ